MASKLPLNGAQTPVTYPCTVCDSEENVRWYCNDCQETLCDRCKEAHKRGKKTRNDDVVPIQQAKRETEQIVPEGCKHHPGKVCDLFCSECEVTMCSMCFAVHHKQHNWKHLEEELAGKQKKVQDCLVELKAELAHLKDNIGKTQKSNEDFNNNIDKMWKDVEKQRSKLKAEVDSVADHILAELLTVKEKESTAYENDRKLSEDSVTEIGRSIDTIEQELKQGTSVSLIELEKTLQRTVKLYDVETKNKRPDMEFVPGVIDVPGLSKMMGHVAYPSHHYIKRIDSNRTKSLASFRIMQKRQIMSICSVSETCSWLSILGYNSLTMIDKTGVIKESVTLTFNPGHLTLFNKTDILMTSFSSLILRMAPDRLMTVFADISPQEGYDISTHDSQEIAVATHDSVVLVLNTSGDLIRKVTCESNVIKVLFTSRNILIGVGNYFAKYLIIKDSSNKRTKTWTGKLDNENKASDMNLCAMACDKYDRVFVPDLSNNQVYVLSSDRVRTRCLLNKNHEIVKPTAVCVDSSGDVWVGCSDGTIHIMRP